jgi:hypothetical protein
MPEYLASVHEDTTDADVEALFEEHGVNIICALGGQYASHTVYLIETTPEIFETLAEYSEHWQRYYCMTFDQDYERKPFMFTGIGANRAVRTC